MSTLLIVRSNGQSLEFDAAPEIRINPVSRITSHPIEDGSTVTDHVQKLPTGVFITGTVTDAPLSSALNTSADRQQDAVDFFEAIREELVIVVSSLFGFIPNLLLVGFPYSWTAGPLFFNVEFRQVTLAEAGVVFIPVSLPAAAQQVGFPDASDSGEQPTTTANEEESDKLSSTSFDLIYG